MNNAGVPALGGLKRPSFPAVDGSRSPNAACSSGKARLLATSRSRDVPPAPVPDASLIPGAPGAPDASDVSKSPAVPEASAASGTPAVLDMSAAPETPRVPEASAASVAVPAPSDPSRVRRICVIGCGPRGASIVERVLANAPDVLRGGRLDLHVVEPFPPGAGRVWRTDQPRLLWMNSAADDVTLFPDASVACAGPARPGPTTGAWLGGPLHDGAYASRADQGRYLRWFFDRVTAQLPPGVRLLVHRARAVDVLRTETERPGGTGRGGQRVVLDDGSAPLEADHVVFATGHRGTLPEPGPDGVTRIGPGPADPERLAAIPPGARVVTRGLGLVFVDCAMLLTEGRGGQFVREGGRLRYLASGREPHLVAGSRRGVPLPPRPALTSAVPAGPPRIATLDACRKALARPGAGFRRDVWPLVVAELTWRHYRQLRTARPGRAVMDWPEFDRSFRSFPAGDERQAKLVHTAVPDPSDRLDLDRLEAPLAGLRFEGPEDLQGHVRAQMAADLRRRRDPLASGDSAVVDGLMVTGAVVEELWRGGGLSPHDVVEALDRFAFGAFLSSGPPMARAERLLALAEAGVVTFVGPGTTVKPAITDAGRRVVRAYSPAVPAAYEGSVLLDARLDRAGPERAEDPMIRALWARGELAEERTGETGTGGICLSGPALHPVGTDGRIHRDRSVAGPAQFPRPGTDAVFFRQNDIVARHALGAR